MQINKILDISINKECLGSLISESINFLLEEKLNNLLLKLSNNKDCKDDDLLCRKDACAFLCISTVTLIKHIKENSIREYKVGRQIRYRKGDLLTFKK